MKEEKFPHSRKLSHRWVCGSFGISEGNITGRGEKEKKKKNTQNTCLTTTASGEVAQLLAFTTRQQGWAGIIGA